MTTNAATSIGDRLRRVRHQQHLSLADVEERSDGRWKAVVVGAYERGDRAVSIARLAGLADFYGLPLAELLPGAEARDGGEPQGGIVLDLTSLEDADSDAVSAVARFAEQIQRTRGDHNGRVLSLRASDVQMLALSAGTDPRELVTHLQDAGALLTPSR
jgi:transcriptional regulator with XRE-family HTH domain